jgi:hypothetical protein
MSTDPAVGVKACECESLPNGVHVHKFNRASKEALDQHFAMLEALIATTPTDAAVHVLVDLRPAGFPPIAYAFQQARAMYGRHPNHAGVSLAFVHRGNVLTSVAHSFFKLHRPSDPVDFFPAEQYDAAIAWLLGDSAEPSGKNGHV